jgi:hypothetical protein
MAMEGKAWSQRFAGIARVFGVGGLAAAIIGTTLARYDLIDKMTGFTGLAFGILASLLALVIGLSALLIAWRRPAPGAVRKTLTGVVPAALLLGVVASYVVPASKYPPLHDASTDLADPPAFEVLELRKDNLAGVGTVENWREIHARAYPDLATLKLDKPVGAVIADAERLARERGWTIAKTDPAAGRLEATAYAAWIRFNDDVVLRVRPTPDGKGSMIDMRSVSRVGVGDLGYNANRVRAFLADLKAS